MVVSVGGRCESPLREGVGRDCLSAERLRSDPRHKRHSTRDTESALTAHYSLIPSFIFSLSLSLPLSFPQSLFFSLSFLLSGPFGLSFSVVCVIVHLCRCLVRVSFLHLEIPPLHTQFLMDRRGGPGQPCEFDSYGRNCASRAFRRHAQRRGAAERGRVRIAKTFCQSEDFAGWWSSEWCGQLHR